MSTTQLQRRSRRAGWRLATVRVVVAAAVVVGAVAHRTESTASVALTSDDAIAIAQGVSVTPAPGWTLGHRGPNWVALNNADTSAQLRITVKPAAGTDAAGLLQADIDQYTNSASAILTDVNRLSAPDVKPLPGANFQQEASINYTATVADPQGTIPVIGTFTEMLNTGNGRSAFIDFRQDSSATTQAAGDGGLMISSMQ